jgi:polyferredoxin
MDETRDGELGARFWLAVAAIAIGGGIAVLVLFALVGRVWYAWGFGGLFALIIVLLLAAGYLSDRREKRRRAALGA